MIIVNFLDKSPNKNLKVQFINSCVLEYVLPEYCLLGAIEYYNLHAKLRKQFEDKLKVPYENVNILKKT